MVVADGTAEQVPHSQCSEAVHHLGPHITGRHADGVTAFGQLHIVRCGVLRRPGKVNAVLLAELLAVSQFIKRAQSVKTDFHTRDAPFEIIGLLLQNERAFATDCCRVIHRCKKDCFVPVPPAVPMVSQASVRKSKVLSSHSRQRVNHLALWASGWRTSTEQRPMPCSPLPNRCIS